MNSLIVIAGIARLLVAAEDDERGQRLLDAMQNLARSTTIRSLEASGAAPPSLVAAPVFRYSDQPRRIVDATLWVWTHGDRPVALQKVEATQRIGQPAWTICFASLATERLSVRWSSDRTYESARGLEFKPLPDPPVPARSDELLDRQVRQISRRFSAEIINTPDGDDSEQMRLLPRPIYEYGDADDAVLRGAIFGFASNGTNPDACLVIELLRQQAGDPLWRYGLARLTTGGLNLKLDDEVVWSMEWVRPVPDAFEAWTFFFEQRTVE